MKYSNIYIIDERVSDCYVCSYSSAGYKPVYLVMGCGVCCGFDNQPSQAVGQSNFGFMTKVTEGNSAQQDPWCYTYVPYADLYIHTSV